MLCTLPCCNAIEGGILFALFSTPFWFAGAQLARQAFGGALLKVSRCGLLRTLSQFMLNPMW